MFNLLAEHNGFGINTDIFETNVLNLSVVIGVLIYYGKGTFSKRCIIYF
jgi:F-type H+-transporting ATPase subunit b